MISKEELIKALSLIGQYTEVEIPKRKGGYRTLLIPSPELKRIQRKILRFLRKIFNCYYGGIYGLRSGSYINHAEYHSNSRFIFLFDLKDAFPSVDISRLRKILINHFTYERIYALEAREFVDLILQLTTFNQVLPQGAPTSPFLFWLAITSSGLFKRFPSLYPNWKISCYVDGFVVSGRKPLPEETKEKILRCVEESGFKVNPEKVHQFDCRQGAPLICGIRIDGKGRVFLSKKKIRKWRGIIHRAALTSDPCEKTDLALKIQGFIASLKPIYESLPSQLLKPYLIFQQSIEKQQLDQKITHTAKPQTGPKEEKTQELKPSIKQKQTRLIEWF